MNIKNELRDLYGLGKVLVLGTGELLLCAVFWLIGKRIEVTHGGCVSLAPYQRSISSRLDT